MEDAVSEDEVVVVTAATPAEDAASIEPAAVGEDVTQTIAVEKTKAVVEAVAEPEEAEEPTVVDAVDAVVIGKMGDAVVEDAVPEEQVAVVAASTPAEEAGPIDKAGVADALPEDAVVVEEPAAVAAVDETVDTDELAVTNVVAAMVTREIEAGIVDDAEPEAAVVAPTLTEDVGPIEPAAVAGYSPETVAVEDEPAVVEALVVPAEPVEPAAIDVDETAVTKDVDVEVVKDAVCEEVVVVAATTPAEDAVAIEAAAVGEDVTEPIAIEQTSAVVKAVAEPVEAEEPTVADVVDAVANMEIEDEVVEGAVLEEEVAGVAALTPIEEVSPIEQACVLPEEARVEEEPAAVEAVAETVETELPAIVDVFAAAVSREIEAEIVKDAEPEVDEAVVADQTPAESLKTARFGEREVDGDAF